MTDTEKLKKEFWKKLSDSPFVMVGLDAGGHSVPLTAQLDEDQVDRIHFLIAKDNRLAKGGAAMLHFIAKGHDYFACVAGEVSEHYDRALIDKYWNKWAEAWFPNGKDDPNLTLLRFDIHNAELWDAEVSLTGRLKILFGGTIDSSETGKHAVVHTTA